MENHNKNDEIDLENLLDSSENHDMNILRHETVLEKEKLRKHDNNQLIEDYFKIKCQGYQKALDDMKTTPYIMMFAGFVDLDDEIIFFLAEMDIYKIKYSLIDIMKSRITSKKEILGILKRIKKN